MGLSNVLQVPQLRLSLKICCLTLAWPAVCNTSGIFFSFFSWFSDEVFIGLVLSVPSLTSSMSLFFASCYLLGQPFVPDCFPRQRPLVFSPVPATAKAKTTWILLLPLTALLSPRQYLEPGFFLQFKIGGDPHSDISPFMQEKVPGDFLWGGTIPWRHCNDKLSNPHDDKGGEWPCLQRSSAVKTKIFHPLSSRSQALVRGNALLQNLERKRRHFIKTAI